MPERNRDLGALIDMHNRYCELAFPVLAIAPVVREILAAMAVPGLTHNAIQYARNRQLTDGSEKAICLYSASLRMPRMLYVDTVTGKRGLITRFFTEKGVRVTFKHGARRQDLYDAIDDPAYQHIVVAGHGSRECWEARDGVVTTRNLETYMTSRQKKEGYWLQHTCGSPRGRPLGAAVMSDPEKVLGYNNLVAPETTIAGHFRTNMGMTVLRDTM